MFASRLADLLGGYQVDLLAYAIMSNHVTVTCLLFQLRVYSFVYSFTLLFLAVTCLLFYFYSFILFYLLFYSTSYRLLTPAGQHSAETVNSNEAGWTLTFRSAKGGGGFVQQALSIVSEFIRVISG
jgi:hypothetical protein